MIVHPERKRKTEGAIYGGAVILTILSFAQIMSYVTALQNRIIGAVLFLLAVAIAFLYFLTQEWEGV